MLQLRKKRLPISEADAALLRQWVHLQLPNESILKRALLTVQSRLPMAAGDSSCVRSEQRAHPGWGATATAMTLRASTPSAAQRCGATRMDNVRADVSKGLWRWDEDEATSILSQARKGS